MCTDGRADDSSWTRIPPVTERPATSPIRAATWLVLGAAFGLGLWLRATPLASAFLFGDELHSLPALGLPWSELVGRYDPVGSGLALPLIQKALVAVLGASLPVLRAVAFVPSLLLIGVVAVWARRERGGVGAAVAAAVLVAIAPIFVFYGHFARSYSLAALLCVGVAVVCAGARHSEDQTRPIDVRRVAVIAVLGGFAVWAHMVSAFFLVGLGLGQGVVAITKRGPTGALRDASLLGLVGAAAVAALLHAPAASGLVAFVGHKGEQVYHAPFGPMDVLGVLAGSVAGARILLVALIGAAVLEARARRAEAAPVLAATFVPGVLLFLVSPYGDAYAYARYLLPSAAAGCVFLGLGSARVGEAIAARSVAWPAAALGVAIAVLLFAAGPRGPFAPPLGRFANTYLGLHPLPAFSETEPVPPSWYNEIEGATPERTLVEVPPLRNRAVHYFAALQAWHGQDVRMGTFGGVVPGAPPLESNLYFDLSRIDEARGEIDLLVVHRRVADEVERYWQRVYANSRDGADEALLQRHRVYGHDVPSVGPSVIEKLELLLGPPAHADVDVVVWRVTETPPPKP